ncbi:MAG: hypothetical protein V4472_11645 [Pseudomonadota bacterium]
MHVSIKNPLAPEQRVAQQPAFIDNPFAPEIFATGFSGFANHNGVIVLTVESARCDHGRQEPVMERVVVGRLALTPQAAVSLVSGLNQFLEQQGLSPSRILANGSTFQ